MAANLVFCKSRFICIVDDTNSTLNCDAASFSSMYVVPWWKKGSSTMHVLIEWRRKWAHHHLHTATTLHILRCQEIKNNLGMRLSVNCKTISHLSLCVCAVTAVTNSPTTACCWPLFVKPFTHFTVQRRVEGGVDPVGWLNIKMVYSSGPPSHKAGSTLLNFVEVIN